MIALQRRNADFLTAISGFQMDNNCMLSIAPLRANIEFSFAPSFPVQQACPNLYGQSWVMGELFREILLSLCVGFLF